MALPVTDTTVTGPAPFERQAEHMTHTPWDATSLVERFTEVRGHTEGLAAPLSPEDQTVQSMPDVSPTKWHRAHVTWFFETFVLAEHERDFAPFQDTYWFLFNSYYETLGPRYSRADRGFITRPGAHDVGVYRSQVDDRMRDLVAGLDGGTLDKLAPTLELGFHHEQQHQELLLMDIKHVLSRNPLQPAYAGTPSATSEPDDLGWVDVEGGLVEVGHEGDGFSFDNELPRHRQWLEPYRLADRLVTNGEWLEFIADGGYRRHELWLSDGWAKVNAADQGWTAPFYWSEHDGVWLEHTLNGTWPVNPGLPVSHGQLLRGRRVRHLGRQAPAHRGRVGARASSPTARPTPPAAGATSPTPRRTTRERPAPRPRAADCARSTATAGSGRRRPTTPTPASTRPPARSASTTASSCPTRWCCAAAAP